MYIPIDDFWRLGLTHGPCLRHTYITKNVFKFVDIGHDLRCIYNMLDDKTN